MKDIETNSTENVNKKIIVKDKHIHTHSDSALYSLGVIGSLFYFLQHATTFTTIVIGIGKALFWPAIVLYRVLTLLRL